MRGSSFVIAGICVVLASCGDGAGGLEDTPSVGALPHDSAAAATEEPTHEAWVLSGFAGDRFVLWEQANDTTLVYDSNDGHTFVAEGRPVGAVHSSFNRFMQMGLAEGAPTKRIAGDTKGRVLLRTGHGIDYVDLTANGRVLANYVGNDLAVDVSPDGAMLAFTTSESIDLLRVADGAGASHPRAGRDEPRMQWKASTVEWQDAESYTRVDRESLTARVYAHRFDAPDHGRTERRITIATSTAGIVALGWEGTAGVPGGVEVYLPNEERPAMTFATPTVSSLHVDDAGTTVAWIERDEHTSKEHMHAIDMASRSHARFPLKGSGCNIAPDTITSIDKGKILTDASCSLGCPSVRWDRRVVAYNATSGVVVSDVTTPETQSWNEELADVRADAETDAESWGVELSHVLRATKGAVVTVPNGLDAITLTKAKARNHLEDSEGAALNAVVLSEPSGASPALVAGVVNGRARVWDAASGRALLR